MSEDNISLVVYVNRIRNKFLRINLDFSLAEENLGYIKNFPVMLHDGNRNEFPFPMEWKKWAYDDIAPLQWNHGFNNDLTEVVKYLTTNKIEYALKHIAPQPPLFSFPAVEGERYLTFAFRTAEEAMLFKLSF